MLHSFPSELSTEWSVPRGTGMAGLTRAAWRARTSATAMLARRLVDQEHPSRLLAPRSGSFNAEVAAALKRWKEE